MRIYPQIRTSYVSALRCLIVGLLGLFASQAQAANVYLASASVGSGNGSSWANAQAFGTYFATYYGQTANANAIPANTNIYIKAGTYDVNVSQTAGAFLINNNILIQGGFPTAATGTDISGYNPLANPTKIRLNYNLGGGNQAGWLASNTNSTAGNNYEVKGLEFITISSSVGGSVININANNGGAGGNFKFTDLYVHDFPSSNLGIFSFRDGDGGGTAVFTNCVFRNNTGTAFPTIADDAADRPLTLTNCSFSGNTVTTGSGSGQGGTVLIRSDVTATNSTWCNNTSLDYGGALLAYSNTQTVTMTLTGCTFTGNFATNGNGGAIFNNNGHLVVSNCNFYGNVSQNGLGGGAIFLHVGDANSTISNSIFYQNEYRATNNTALDYSGGAAIFLDDQSKQVSITNSKFVGNFVSGTATNTFRKMGGAIEYRNGSGAGSGIVLNNDLFFGNVSGSTAASTSPSASIPGADVAVMLPNNSGNSRYTITNCQMQLPSNSTTYYYALSTGGTPVPYSWSTGNTFSNTSDGGVGTPSYTCPTSIATPPTITGTVWNDANGDALFGGSESGTNGGGSLYVNLVNGSGALVLSAPVAANGTYSMAGYPASATGYKLVLSTSDMATTPGPLPSGYINTGEAVGVSNSAAQTTTVGQIEINTGTSNITNQDFGMVVPAADVSVVKTGPATVNANGTLSYTLLVANAGPVAANGATLTDPAVGNFTVTSVTCGNATGGAACPGSITAAALQAGTVTIATFPANSSITVTVTGTAGATAGTINNTAIVTPPPSFADPNFSNNRSTASTTINCPAAPVQTSVPCATRVFVAASASGSGNGSSWNNAKSFASLIAGGFTPTASNTYIYLKAGTYTYNTNQPISMLQNQDWTFVMKGGYPASATGTDLSGYNPAANLTTVNITSATPNGVFANVPAAGTHSFTLQGIRFVNQTSNAISYFYRNTGNSVSSAQNDIDLFKDLEVTGYSGNTSLFFYNQSLGKATFENAYLHDNSTSSATVVNSLSATTLHPIYFNNSSFVNNINTTGTYGGFLNTSGDIYATNSYFCGNGNTSSIVSYGGAMATQNTLGGSVPVKYTIDGCSFYNNYCNSGFGGAIFMGSGTLTITNTKFGFNYVNNNNTGGGGAIGIWNKNNYQSTITNCDFYRNYVTTQNAGTGFYGGGAIQTQLANGSLVVNNSRFVQNFLTANSPQAFNGIYGGAVYYMNSSTSEASGDKLEIKNSYFSDNQIGNTNTSGTGALNGSNTAFSADVAEYQGPAASAGGNGNLILTNNHLQLPSTDYVDAYGKTNANNYTLSGNLYATPNGAGLTSLTQNCPSAISAPCGDTADMAPLLPAAPAICNGTVLDLTTLTASNIGGALQLKWHTGTPGTASNLVSNPTTAGPGTYYATFYDPATGCYSNTSLAFVITSQACNADLSIAKTGPTTVNTNGSLSYTLVVTNSGPLAANGATVSDPAVGNFTVSSVSCGSATGGAACPASTTVAALQNGTLSIPTLPSNSTITITVTGTAGTNAGTISNTAIVTPPPGYTDNDLTNNRSTATTTISCPATPVQTSVPCATRVFVAASASGSGNGSSWDNAKSFASLISVSGGYVPSSANTYIYLKAGTYNYNTVNSMKFLQNQNWTFVMQGGFPASATGTDLSGYNPVANVTTINILANPGNGMYLVQAGTGTHKLTLKGIKYNKTATGGSSQLYFNDNISTNSDIQLFKDIEVTGYKTGDNYVFFFNGANGTATFDNVYVHDNTTGNASIKNSSALHGDHVLYFINSSFVNNVSGDGYGGAIRTSGDLYATNTYFCSNGTNYTGGYGGAIATQTGLNATPGNDVKYVIDGCSFYSNFSTTQYGGAIFMGSGYMNITNTRFAFNRVNGNTTGGGGAIGIFNSGNTQTTITGCDFYRNYTTAQSGGLNNGEGGGAIAMKLCCGSVVINNSRFVENFTTSSNVSTTSGIYGGAIYYKNDGTVEANGDKLEIKNSYFFNNRIGNTNVTGSGAMTGSNTAFSADVAGWTGAANDVTGATGNVVLSNNNLQLPVTSYVDAWNQNSALNYTFSGNLYGTPNSGNLTSLTQNCPSAISAPCGDTADNAPIIPSGKSICYSSTYNLNTVVASNIGGALQLKWHTGTPGTASNLVSNPAAAGPGTYYATFYDPATGCYGNTSKAFVITNVFCGSVSGTVYNDPNGVTDNAINGTPVNALNGNTFYVSLVDGSGNVVSSIPVAANGTYTFDTSKGLQPNTTYTIALSNSLQSVGVPPSTLLNGVVNTSEAIDPAYQDGNANGVLSVTVGTGSVIGANFGVEVPPTAGSGTFSAGTNPAGTTPVTVPAGTFTNTTASSDPTAVTAVRITTFPAGATSISVGTTTYYATAGAIPGTCPTASCSVFPLGGVVVPTDASGNPTQSITVDPSFNGSGSVVFSFKAVDAAGIESSNTGTATVNFTTAIAGNVFNDVNGLTDNTVNGTGTNAGGLNAILVDGSGNVVATTTVSASGAYSFTGLTDGTYSVLITTNTGTLGQPAPAVVLPAGWVSTGENNGSGTGSDGTPNGILTPINLSAPVTQANFGIEQPPTAGSGTLNAGTNPGGTSQVTVSNTAFTSTTSSSDPSPGGVTAIRITSFPAGATSVVINGVSYTSGTWPTGGVTVPTDASGNPTQSITVDPGFNGSGSVVFSFKAVDAAGIESSNTGTASVNFTTAIAGNVYNDANGLTDNTVNGTGTNAGGLNAILVDGSGNVVATTAVSASGAYSFTGLTDGTYSVLITTNTGTLGQPAPAVVLPGGWVATGENNGSGIGSDGTPNGILTPINLSAPVTQANFGIEQPPVGNNYTATAQLNPGGTNTIPIPAAAFTGTDAEDGTYTTGLSGKKVTLTPGTNGDLYYNGVKLTGPLTIASFNPALLGIDPTGPNPTGYSALTSTFSYSVYDAAGVPSIAKTITMPFDAMLCIKPRVYLEGALMNNNSATAPDGRPLMRDDLRNSPFTGLNYIPVQDPYEFATAYVDITSRYTKLAPQNNAHPLYQSVTDSATVFGVSGQNAIVDWVFVELRNKSNKTQVQATRAALLQRDGDVVETDGVGCLEFPAVTIDSYYVSVRHRSHFGTMTRFAQSSTQLATLVDFTVTTTPLFDKGTQGPFDFTGLSQKENMVGTYRAMWQGDFDGDGKIKYDNPDDDLSIMLFDVLFHPNNSTFATNYDFGYGYRQGDFDMNSKTKYDNPDDDNALELFQVLFYSQNSQFASNFDFVLQQLP